MVTTSIKESRNARLTMTWLYRFVEAFIGLVKVFAYKDEFPPLSRSYILLGDDLSFLKFENKYVIIVVPSIDAIGISFDHESDAFFIANRVYDFHFFKTIGYRCVITWSIQTDQ